jgi:hypothetical protein
MVNMEAKIANVALQIARNGTARGRCDCWHRVGVLCCPSSRGVGGSGQGYNNLLDGGGKRSKSQFDFHHPRFQFHIAPWARCVCPGILSSETSLHVMEMCMVQIKYTRL